MKKGQLILMLLVFNQMVSAQVYVEKQSRHRFAQMNLGIDLQTSIGGRTKYFDKEMNVMSMELPSLFTPRFIIGGTHFWGHADFYVAIPLTSRSIKENEQQINFERGVETAFKYYPWRIESGKIRPFVGLSISPFNFEQGNGHFVFDDGPDLNYTALPLLAGLTFNHKNHLFNLTATWNYDNRQSYFISRQESQAVQLPPFYLGISYKYMLETTLSAEKSWESGRTSEVTDKLAKENKLNGFYVGVGFSSAFWLSKSSYNQTYRPWINRYGISTMPDFTLGYYFHEPDMNMGFAYRSYSISQEAYGARQEAQRNSLVFEITKALFDYHGFVPFVGPALSYENLRFTESFENVNTQNENEDILGYGLTFGWDIRPNQLQSWILRTNLRYFPNLNLGVDNETVAFENIEFNFIQLIIYPERMF